MYFTFPARARPLVAAGLVTIVSLAGASSAQAQMVYFQGYTNGCFGPCVPVANPAYQTSVLNGNKMGFQNSQFEGTTAGGALSMGASASAWGVQNTNNFGAFYLSSNAYSYAGSTFELLITFVNPAAHSQFYTAALSGVVMHPEVGGVYVDFPNNAFFWNDGDWTYSVAINDVDLRSPDAGLMYFAAPITGRLTATQSQVVPEPMTMTLLGTGLLAIGGVVRRRRRKTGEADLI